MKRKLMTFALAVLTVGLLGSCSKMNERIDNLEKKVDGIENNQIATIGQQIAAITTSIDDLKAADAAINGKIDELKATANAHQTLIDALKEADKALGQKDEELEGRIATLEGQVATINGQIEALVNADKAINTRIDELKSYVDTQIGNTKDWAEETFATLDQYQQTADDLAALSVTVTGISTTLAGVQTSISGLDTKIDGINTDLQGKITAAKTELEGKITSLKTELEGKIASAISASETSIKSWINKLLEGYYTIAEVDAKITGLNTAIEAAKGTSKYRIDSLATELTKLKKAVDTATTAIRSEYKTAIATAITKLDGEIRGALKDSILAVNGRIEALDTRVTTLEGKVLSLEGNVNKLLAMIQSVSITPAYSDGSVEAEDGILTLKCIVRPAEALTGMQSLKDSLLIYADLVKVKTKATPAYMEIKVSEASVLDAAQGAITLKADISEYLPEDDDKALTVAVNVKNGISDYTTEFVTVYPVAGPAAKVGETTYPTLAAAIEAVSNNGTVTLLKDITNAVGIALPAGKGFTLDFDGHSYTVGGPGAGTPATAAFEIPQTSTIVFKNGTIRCPEGNKSKTGTEGISTIIRNNGGLTLTNISIDGTNLAKDGANDGTLIVNTNTIEDIDGGTYTNNGPVLVSESGIVAVGGSGANKVTITSRDSTAIIVWKSQVTLKDGVYTGAKGVVSFPGTVASEIEIKAGTYNSADYPVLLGDKNGKNNKVTVEGGTFNATATGDNVPCGIFSPGNDNIIVKGGTFNVPGESTSAAGGTGVTILNGKLTIEEEQGMPAPKFNVGKTEGRGKVLGIDVKRGYSITLNKNYGTPSSVTADPDKYPQGTIAALPVGALAGEFTVNAEGRTVYFSQGNLWYGRVGSATTATWNFETNQYDSTPSAGGSSWSTDHISHFYWSKTGSVAYAKNYSESSTSVNDVFFTNATAETAKTDFTVDGVTGKYRTLSTAEWQYLINKNNDENIRKGKYKYGVTVCEKANCLILVPDECLNGYSFDNTKTSYSVGEWATAEAAGLVCLPAAGMRYEDGVGNVGGGGNYWLSSTYIDNDTDAYRVTFDSGHVGDAEPALRDFGFSVRLITESK